jgi:hypothetical protein
MARLIRVEYAGATYHVMGRGNQGKAISGSDEDRRWVSERLRMGDESRGPLPPAFPPGQPQPREPERSADSLGAEAAGRGWVMADALE